MRKRWRRLWVGTILFAVFGACAADAAYAQSSTSPEERLLQAQAKYYESLSAPKSVFQEWGSLIQSLAGALIGAVAALSGVRLTNRGRRADEINKEKREAVAKLIRALAAGIQAMSWLTWNAQQKSSSLLKEQLAEYEKLIGTVLPEIVSARAVVAAWSKEAHDQLTPFVTELYDFDVKIGEIKLTFTGTAEQKTELGKLLNDVNGLDAKILVKGEELLTRIR